MMDFRQRWIEDWASLGLTADGLTLERLLASHAAPGRHYHTLQHLGECLELFDQVTGLAERPGEVAIALWFHDVVYVPLAHDNEARSAAWAAEALHAAGAGHDLIARIQAHIMATAAHEASEDLDRRLVLDIDLAILGADPARFAQYDEQVRAEYSAVPENVYRQKRREVLARFLARPAIYATPALHERLEARARTNLQRAIERSP